MNRTFETKDIQSRICDWFLGSTGEIVLHQERQAFARMIQQLFGYHLLQLGWLDDSCPMMADSKMTQQILLGELSRPETQGFLTADFQQLPIMTDSIDAVLLPHTLDFCRDPQQVLREVERVLIPEGHLIIAGFNPMSLSGIGRAVQRKHQPVPWNAHFVSYTRLHDWLSLLGLSVEQTEVMIFRPLLSNPRLMQRLQFMESLGQRLWPRFGSVYMIKAVKRVSTMTPVKPVWKRRPRLLSQVVEPSTRGINRILNG